MREDSKTYLLIVVPYKYNSTCSVSRGVLWFDVPVMLVRDASLSVVWLLSYGRRFFCCNSFDAFDVLVLLESSVQMRGTLTIIRILCFSSNCSVYYPKERTMLRYITSFMF